MLEEVSYIHEVDKGIHKVYISGLNTYGSIVGKGKTEQEAKDDAYKKYEKYLEVVKNG